MNELGSMIRVARKRKRIRANKLAKMVGITPGAMSLIETGKTRPRVQILQKICNILELDFKEMFALGKYEESIKEKSKSELGNKIKTERMRRAMQIEEIAEAIGMTKVNFYRIEEGRVRPKFESLNEICKILELDFNEMIEIGNYSKRSIKLYRELC